MGKAGVHFWFSLIFLSLQIIADVNLHSFCLYTATCSVVFNYLKIFKILFKHLLGKHFGVPFLLLPTFLILYFFLFINFKYKVHTDRQHGYEKIRNNCQIV